MVLGVPKLKHFRVIFSIILVGMLRFILVFDICVDICSEFVLV